MREIEKEKDVYWVSLGDLVHGPDDRARRDEPDLYGFPDESWHVVEMAIKLRAQFPDNFFLILGNHDHGHIGGPLPAKFYSDEVAHFESNLDGHQKMSMRQLFEEAYLMIFAPCGALLSHGSPDDSTTNLDQLENLSFDPMENSVLQNRILGSSLRSYGQAEEVTQRLLEQLSLGLDFDLNVVIHGHDRELDGYFKDGQNQLCPVIFGARNSEKRYVRLQLSSRYRSVSDLRDGIEIERLHRNQ